MVEKTDNVDSDEGSVRFEITVELSGDSVISLSADVSDSPAPEDIEKLCDALRKLTNQIEEAYDFVLRGKSRGH